MAITLIGCMMNSCQQGNPRDVDNNDRIPSKYIVYTQYIINPQNGECYGYIDSIFYWKKYQSDILLVYTSELTGENIYSPYNIIILKEDGIIQSRVIQGCRFLWQLVEGKDKEEEHVHRRLDSYRRAVLECISPKTESGLPVALLTLKK